MDDREEIKLANTAFYRAIESGMIERMEGLWEHEEYVCCVHPGWDRVVGWAKVRYSWEQIFAGEQRMRIFPTEVSIHYSGEVAWVSCIENITLFQDTNFDTVQAAATNLFIQRGGKWLMVHHHASPIPMILPDSESDTIQ
ncbi:MAG: nuclear transport factor 2 family protein [Acidobacteriota bacterium]